jgi:hypothetical protein
VARVAALTLHVRARELVASGGASDNLTVEQWISAGAGGDDLAAVLRPLATAALNEAPGEGSAVLFARVLDRLLSAPAARSGLALPRRALGDLVAGFEDYLASRGGTVRYRETVLGVRIEQERAVGVSLLGGGRVDAGTTILALPHERVGWVLRPEYLAPLRAVASLPWAPIVSSLHIYDRPVLPSRFVGMIGTKTQWAFDRGAATSARRLVGTLRSAAFGDIGRGLDEIAREADAELREAFPEARPATLLEARVYKERRATIRSTPEVQRLRPGPRTSVDRLLLAGDWTDTGLPPTIEGAVQSGHRAASLAA